MKIARVFPRQTKASPTDALAFYDVPPMLCELNVDKVDVSVTFTYDKDYGEFLAEQWNALGVPVEIGGPAYGKPAGEFIPGKYLKDGYTITSRGCSNNCWFCYVSKRQGGLLELEIKDGYIVQDDNLLSCSENHIRKVFEMLNRQRHRPIFSGGIEAKLLKPWHIELLQKIKPKEMFFAYDTPDDYEPLVNAGKMLDEAGMGIKTHKARCYVLCGYKNDTFEKANKRMMQTLEAGFMPFAMVYKGDDGVESPGWQRIKRQWIRPAAIVASFPQYFAKD